MSDFPEDLPLTMDEHVQKAVDCYNAGATVLHIHVRELDGKGSKRLSKFNELLGLLREAVPDMILQVGGSISFAPEGEGADAKWLSDDTRHMLADLYAQARSGHDRDQHDADEHHGPDVRTRNIADTSLADPATYHAYREMIVPAGPEWVEEHLRRLVAAGIQPHFQLTCMPDLETLERLVRRGHYNGPVNLTWVGIGGGFDGPNPNNFMEFIRRAPDGSTVTLESVMRNVLPINVMAMCLGMHTRCGNEDTLYDQHGDKITSVQQIEQLVRVAKELGREIATAKEAREIYKIGVQYNSVDETLAQLGMPPNREPGRRALPNRYAA